jgi:hypothetical protein
MTRASLFVLLLGAPPLRAQSADYDYGFTSLTTWAVSIPTGDTKRFVPSTSWMGVAWEMQWNQAKTSTGIEFGLHDFFDQSTGTTTFGSGAATGSQFRDLLVTTVLGTARWYPVSVAGIGPSLGIAAGAVYAQQAYQLGIRSQLIRSGFHLAVAPQVAVAIPVFNDVAAVLTARYTLPTSGGQYLGGGSRQFRYVTVSAGFAER